jgi:ABC-type xylose transport system permease subunit
VNKQRTRVAVALCAMAFIGGCVGVTLGRFISGYEVNPFILLLQVGVLVMTGISNYGTIINHSRGDR